jgi:Zn-dependent peptidase ImmA (M78 family)/DNA-binding XRE family transcriptional regulator
MSSQHIGERVSALRIARGMTQADLARVIDRHPTVVTKLEAGQRGVNSYELALIAETLDTTVDDLLGRSRATAPMRLAARIAHAPYPPEAQEAVARVRRLFELEALLDRIVPGERLPRPPHVVPPHGGLALRQGATLAAELRRLLGLDNHPVTDLPQLIEQRLGMDVAIEPLPDGIDGLCVQMDGAALAVANADHFPGKQRFTLAHEACHHLNGDAQDLVVERLFTGSKSPEEIRANAFAAHFLMPPSAITDLIGQGPLSDRAAAQIMLVFGASLQAVAWHLFNLRKIDSNERDHLLALGPGSLFSRAGFRSEWQAAQQSRGVRRPPARLQERAIRAYTTGGIGIGPLADLFAVPDAEKLREDLAAEGIAPPTFDTFPAPSQQ